MLPSQLLTGATSPIGRRFFSEIRKFHHSQPYTQDPVNPLNLKTRFIEDTAQINAGHPTTQFHMARGDHFPVYNNLLKMLSERILRCLWFRFAAGLASEL
jgi:hypothetical protein